MKQPNQLGNAFNRARNELSGTDKTYRLGYFIALLIACVGIIMIIAGVIVTLMFFSGVDVFPHGFGGQMRYLSFQVRLMASAPALGVSVSGLALFLASQLAIAIFDMSRAAQTAANRDAR